MRFALTLLVGALAGGLLHRLKVPGGMMVGSIIGTAFLNVGFQMAYIPYGGKIAAQLTAGAFIGASVQRSDFYGIRRLALPAGILMSAYLAVNLSLGLLIACVSPLDLGTALFGTVPGGISDIPLIAADMGADAPKVVMLQFVRLVVGIGLFPGMIAYLCRFDPPEALPQGRTAPPEGEGKKISAFLLTAAVAVAAGTLGAALKIPAGPLVLSMAGVAALKLIWGVYSLPEPVRRVAQALSGAYIGCSLGLQDLLELRHLALPAVILVVGYSLNCFVCGWALRRYCGMGRKVALLSAVPTGASDMALISMDMGVQSPELAVLQVLRLVTVSAVFPQIIGLILRLVPA